MGLLVVHRVKFAQRGRKLNYEGKFYKDDVIKSHLLWWQKSTVEEQMGALAYCGPCIAMWETCKNLAAWITVKVYP